MEYAIPSWPLNLAISIKFKQFNNLNLQCKGSFHYIQLYYSYIKLLIYFPLCRDYINARRALFVLRIFSNVQTSAISIRYQVAQSDNCSLKKVKKTKKNLQNRYCQQWNLYDPQTKIKEENPKKKSEYKSKSRKKENAKSLRFPSQEKMKIFVGLEQLTLFIGITSHDPSSRNYICLQIFRLIGFVSCTISMIWYLMFGSGTFIDSTEAFYYTCAYSSLFVTYIDLMCEQENLFLLITLLESRILRRMCKKIVFVHHHFNFFKFIVKYDVIFYKKSYLSHR